LVPVSDLEKMAHAVAASKLFGITTPEQAMALMLVAQAEGLHPATAARDYHIIQGRPTLKADAMLARYLASGGKVEWHEHTDTKVAATFTHPQGGSLRIEWDMARAKVAELKSAMWTKYPRQMLRARVISEGVRATNPAVAVGIYTPEEAADFEPAGQKGRGAKAKPAGDAEIVQETGEIVQSDRDKELKELCAQAGTTPLGYLVRLKVKSASELSDADYQGILANVRSKIKTAQDQKAA
jgi:hypothetical protein